jgi:hypothetical protein
MLVLRTTLPRLAVEEIKYVQIIIQLFDQEEEPPVMICTNWRLLHVVLLYGNKNSLYEPNFYED